MDAQLTNTPAGENNSTPSWSVELTAKLTHLDSFELAIKLSGTGTVTIDWGDGTVLETFQMRELKTKYSNRKWCGTKYEHLYPLDTEVTYSVKISGQGGYLTLFNIEKGFLPNYDVFSVVLKHCDRLQYLYCGNNRLASLDVSQCTLLEELYCFENQLKSLNISGCTQLKELDCHENQLRSFNISECTQLKKLNCFSNRLTWLNVSHCTQLEELYCSGNELPSLYIGQNPQLKQLSCGDNELTSLNVSKNLKLESLSCGSNPLSTLDVSPCTLLKDLACGEDRLTSLDISRNTQLRSLWYDCNPLSAEAMNQVYNDLPVVNQGEGKITINQDTAGDHHIAEEKGWKVIIRYW